MILLFLLTAIGFVMLSYGAVFLVDGASSLAKRLKVSQIAIGLTIVAFGTSAPELIVNVVASFKGSAEIAFGNVLGSNIFNILIVLGVAGLIHSISVKEATAKKEIPFLLIGTLLIFGFVNNFGFPGANLSRWDGFFIIIILIVFYFFILKDTWQDQHTEEIHSYKLLKSLFLILIGMFGLFFGAQLVVNNAIEIALRFNVSEKFIGLTVVAFGTSLPELITSVVAVKKKHFDMAIGNIVGSNLFNLLLVLGVSSVISPMKYDLALNIDFIVLIFITIFLLITMFIGKKYQLEKQQAIIFLIIYGAYFIYLYFRG